tara:strand:- start:284 stop:391 length:108 start_codon:yes stop_codon:yes gene_type:complete
MLVVNYEAALVSLFGEILFGRRACLAFKAATNEEE